MINPITLLREDYCIKCNTPRMIECYDIFNRPIYFSLLLDKSKSDIIYRLNIRDLYYMKCKRCNTAFTLNWSNGDIPRPLFDKNSIRYFMNENFNGLNKK